MPPQTELLIEAGKSMQIARPGEKLTNGDEIISIGVDHLVYKILASGEHHRLDLYQQASNAERKNEN